MSLNFSKSLTEYLEEIVVGPPLYDPKGNLQNLVIYPVFPRSLAPHHPEIVTLSIALEKGLRLTDTGVVSRVHVDNPLPVSVLASESETLIGSTQQRSVQFSCLLDPKRKAALPVSCVEEGQPTEYQAEFSQTDTCPWSLRSFKMDQLARFGEPPQHWVWDQIKTYLADTATRSATHNIHSVLDQNSHQLQTLSKIFPPTPGQTGAICAVGQSLIIELFGDPEIFADRYDKVLRSALVEAVAQPSDKIVPAGKIPHFLNQIIEACQTTKVMNNRSLNENGRSLAFTHLGLSGQALIAKGHLIHLSAHQQWPGQGQPLADLCPEMDAARADWESHRPPFMDELAHSYSRRLRRYNSFKSKLQPSSTSDDQQQKTDVQNPKQNESAPQAVPLNPELHRFFLRLFNRD